MPIPQPKKNESEKEYIQRFMSDTKMLKEFPKKDQRYQVQITNWNDEHNGKPEPGKDEYNDHSKMEETKMLLSKDEYKEIVIEQKQLDPTLDTFTIMETVQQQIEDTEMLNRLSTLQENAYTDMVKNKGNELLGKAGEVAKNVQSKQQEGVSSVGKGLSKAQENTGAWAASQKDSAQKFLQDNPAATVAIATAGVAGLAGIIQALRKKRQEKKIANQFTEKIDKQLKAAIKRRKELMYRAKNLQAQKSSHARKVGAQTAIAATGEAQAIGSQLAKHQALEKGAQAITNAKGAADVTRTLTKTAKENILKKFQELRPGETPTREAFKDLQASNNSFKELLTQADSHMDATRQQSAASREAIKKYGEEAQEIFNNNMNKIGAGQLAVTGIAGLYAIYKSLRNQKIRLEQQNKDTKEVDAKMKQVTDQIKKLKKQKKETGKKAISQQKEQRKQDKLKQNQNPNVKPQ